MNILFIAPYVPNLIRVRPYNFIRFLAGRGHHITLATVWTGEKERESLSELQDYCARIHSAHVPVWRSLWNVAKALPSRQPLQAVYSWQPSLARQVSRLAEDMDGPDPIDVVHVEHLRGAVYGLYLKQEMARMERPVPVVWDSVDSISYLFRQAMSRSRSLVSRAITRFELSRTEPFERWLLRQFDHVLVTSDKDRQVFTSGQDFPARISVLENGVDLAYFKPDEDLARDPATVVVSGKMSYHANVAMVLRLIEEIMPLVWRARPEVRVLVVGKDPPKKIKAYNSHPQIEVTGTVQDLRPYLQRATIAVAPITYGAGIQNKVLEAMACRTPVVASPYAVSALRVKPNEEILVAGEPGEFSSQILDLLDNRVRRERIGSAGRAYVERNHQWSSIARELEGIYQQAVDQRNAQSENAIGVRIVKG